MAAEGARPLGVTPGGEYTAVIEVARRASGSFSWANLNILAGTRVGPGVIRPAPFPALTGGFAAIGWGPDYRRVYYADADGALIELGTNGESWAYRNFTSELGAPAAAWNSPLAAGGWLDGRMNVYYAAESGDLTILLFDGGWRLGTDAKTPKVASNSPLAAMQNDRGCFAYYFDDLGHLREVEAFGTHPAQATDLTSFIKLPSASRLSGLAALGRGNDARRVYYADTANNLIEAIGYGETKGWSWQNLASIGARPLKDGGPLAAAFRISREDASVTGVAQFCRESKPVWLSRTGNGWSSQDIYSTRAGVRPVAAANSYVACAVSGDGRPWVTFVTDENHLVLWRGPASDWSWWDLTADGLPPVAKVAAQGPLALVHTEDGPRVYYLTDEPAY